ncbi:uncharacterized protein LOC127123822 [Lathyrus oleraceus]|uniref:uncharacterized protein LOC127123822 n=1 Tax=Pisum sativum TaxID=3888 RepID=UPI0021CFF277|nr:uncharacterized protein LOC127123822 [Pisum sativum]
MHLPFGSDSNHVSGLWVYGEFLSVCSMNDTNDTIEIWVMKEYKVNSSWIRTLVLPVDLINSPNQDLIPLCCTKSGDIIGIDENNGLVKYDKNGQFLERRSYFDYDLRSKATMYIEATMHIDSLLSLPGDGDNEQKKNEV